MKRILLITSIAWSIMACTTHSSLHETEKDKFVSLLMSQMTMEEKIGQLNFPTTGDITAGQTVNSGIAEKIKEGKVGGLCIIGVDKIRELQRLAVDESRLGIPLLFGIDVIHGYKTGFPIPLALASTWDMEMIQKSARIAAEEATTEGICWTFSPMTDICRDPRWGRIAESSGEDPYLGGEIARAMVKGYQGTDLTLDNTILACVKHFALYGAPEGGRDYNTVDMSRVRMYNEYLPPYKAAVEAGAGSVMASFNEIDGIPATANKWLLDDLLRTQWGFDGFVVSDYTGISEMTDHGIGNLQTVAARALNAGLDMDLVSEAFLTTLQNSVKEGKTTEKQIDKACRRILEAKYKLGLFDDPYKYCQQEKANRVFSNENRAFARKTAAESFVLLKNKHVLPLQKKGVIALVGPLANTRANMPGTWSVSVDLGQPATLLEALTKAAGNQARIIYSQGSNLFSDALLQARSTMFGREIPRDERSEQVIINEALQVARGADVIIAALGESSEMSGESSSRSDIEIPDVQKRLLAELLKTGKPVVLVLFTGRPLALTWEEENVPAILNVWFGGTEAAHAITDVLFGDVNPGGKLTVTFPRNLGQVPLYYNHKNTGRPLAQDKWFEKFRSNYLDVSNDPLYPFGYGLSYTTFEYGAVKLNSKRMMPGENITAKVEVRNSGQMEGNETVQLYLRDVEGSITRPVKELKGFQKINLRPGETKEVAFEITDDMLKFYDYNLDYICEPGEFEVMIGGNSRDTKSANFIYEIKRMN